MYNLSLSNTRVMMAECVEKTVPLFKAKMEFPNKELTLTIFSSLSESITQKGSRLSQGLNCISGSDR